MRNTLWRYPPSDLLSHVLSAHCLTLIKHSRVGVFTSTCLGLVQPCNAMLAVLTCSMAHNQIGTPTAPSLHLPSGAQRLYSLQKGDSLTQLKRPDTVQIVEQLWSTRLNRGAAQREGSGTPSAVEWQPLYPALRVPGSNPQSLPELKAFHGLGRVEVPGVALACAPSASTQSAPATSVIVAPGGAYKFVGVPGKPEADSVPLTHPNPDDPDPVEPHPHPNPNHRCYSGSVPREMWRSSFSNIAYQLSVHRRRPRSATLAGCRGEMRH